MGRPPAHDVDSLLDAAVTLFADGGVRAVTMAAIAREAGAPSGSVYHRFADRPTLLASLWLRTVQRFQQGWFAALEHDDPIEAAVAGAGHAVQWCRANAKQATVLNAGRRAFEPDSWPREVARQIDDTDAAVEKAIKDLVKRVKARTGDDGDTIALAVADVPYAVLRRYLTRGRTVPPRASELVETAVRRLIDAP